VLNEAPHRENVWGSGGIAPPVLTLARDGGQLHALVALPLGKSPCTHWIEGWVGYRAGLEDTEKRKILPLPGIKTPAVQPVARSTSLYQLRK
jgi:hypothetical protein